MDKSAIDFIQPSLNLSETWLLAKYRTILSGINWKDLIYQAHKVKVTT